MVSTAIVKGCTSAVIALYAAIPIVLLLLVARSKFHVHRYGINQLFCVLLLTNCTLSIAQWSLSLECDWHDVVSAGSASDTCGNGFQIVRALAQAARHPLGVHDKLDPGHGLWRAARELCA